MTFIPKMGVSKLLTAIVAVTLSFHVNVVMLHILLCSNIAGQYVGVTSRGTFIKKCHKKKFKIIHQYST